MFLKRAIAIHESTLDFNNSFLTNVLYGLANLYFDTGRLKGAGQIFICVISIRKKLLGLIIRKQQILFATYEFKEKNMSQKNQ